MNNHRKTVRCQGRRRLARRVHSSNWRRLRTDGPACATTGLASLAALRTRGRGLGHPLREGIDRRASIEDADLEVVRPRRAGLELDDLALVPQVGARDGTIRPWLQR